MNVDLSHVWLIARREWGQKVRQRSFIIATLVQIVVLLAIVLAPTVVSAIFGDDDNGSSVDQVAVVDRADTGDAVATLNEFAQTGGLGDQIQFVAGDAALEPDQAVGNAGVDAVLTVERAEDGSLAFTYTNGDGTLDQTAALAHAAAGELTLRDSLLRAGVDAEAVAQVQTVPQVAMQSAGDSSAAAEDTEEGFRYGVAYASAIVMYMVVLIYGMWIAQGVVEEKSSRIMEIMINAARPSELMFGKIVGIGLAGLTQLVPLLAIAGIGLYSQQRLADALDVTGTDFSGIDLGQLSVTLVAFFLIYFLLGFILYAALYAGVGSLVSRQEDVGTVTTPLTFAIVIGFFAALFTMGAPNSLVAQIVSIVPLTAPMTMVPRILLGDPATWEIVLSIVLLALTGYLAVVFAARIYRMGVLMYGQKPSLKVIFRRGAINAAR